MSTTRKLIGRRIAELRRARGWSQGMLARSTELEQRDISAYENGRAFPRPERLDAIAKALGVTPEVLLCAHADASISPHLSPEAQRAAALIEHGMATNPSLTRRVLQVIRALLRA